MVLRLVCESVAAADRPKTAKSPLWNNAKLGQKGSLDLVFEILVPLYMSGTDEAGSFKFGMQIGHWGPMNKCKIGS